MRIQAIDYNQNDQIGMLTVVGAGPGDPELITVKAIRALSTADVILYDALVNEVLLEYAPKKAEKIFVGKRKGCYAYQQEQINSLIVYKAKLGLHVIRLKGGDPFVFGRGSEEIDEAKSHGIKTAIVPGISSAIAVPAYQGIPLTKRGVAESFWVITGTTRTHRVSSDIEIAAQSDATVVILMGMSKLSEIVAIFAAQNKTKIPVAIIQNGTTLQEEFVTGTIDTIEQLVKEKKLTSPAIIVIGEVVAQKSILSVRNKVLQNIKANELYSNILG
ncbi:uroporphyrinogen-III C-methyltransferase [Aquimarina sp. W85]|uniref:uroporphyrinogen-III C-methyltransferase n=1 Tax=Aquimarina rhodophyticola TaxID=3342246 RepID=UPI0036720397